MKKKNYSKEDAIIILRKLVRTKYDYQKLRIATSNRLEKKADGSSQDKPEEMKAELDVLSIPDMVDTLNDAKGLEDDLDKRIASYLSIFPIYNEYLSKVKGCGAAMSAVIISEIDISKASAVSKMWQYAGLNPAEIRGTKKVDGEAVKVDEMVRGDKATPGFVIPYNKFLKSKLIGVLADCMIKCNSPYRVYYDNLKNRLSNSEKEYKPGRPWKDESKAHISNAAKRYMIKNFLRELYVHWRTLEGLPVRCSYEEEYLGHKTSMQMVMPLEEKK